MALTVEEAKAEIAKIQPKLAEMDKLRLRMGQLQQFVVLGEQLSTTNGAHVQVRPSVAPAAGDHMVPVVPSRLKHIAVRKAPTADLAHAILLALGPLSEDALLAQMRSRQWKGPVEDKAAKKAIYASLHRLTDKFSQVEGKWTALTGH